MIGTSQQIYRNILAYDKKSEKLELYIILYLIDTNYSIHNRIKLFSSLKNKILALENNLMIFNV